MRRWWGAGGGVHQTYTIKLSKSDHPDWSSCEDTMFLLSLEFSNRIWCFHIQDGTYRRTGSGQRVHTFFSLKTEISSTNSSCACACVFLHRNLHSHEYNINAVSPEEQLLQKKYYIICTVNKTNSSSHKYFSFVKWQKCLWTSHMRSCT